MSFRIVYKTLAQIEAAEAYAWYAQPEINMGVRRTNSSTRSFTLDLATILPRQLAFLPIERANCALLDRQIKSITEFSANGLLPTAQTARGMT